jgi:hypothetical protein
VANAVASISIIPASAIGGLTTSIQYSVDVRNGNGDPLPSQPVTWASSDSTILAVSNTGIAHGVGIGTAAIMATAGGKSGFASATIVLYPNQPAGLTPFAELDFSGLPAAHGNTGVLQGDWWTQQSAFSPAHIVVASDGTAPQSPPNVLSMDYAIGTEPGYSGPPGSGLRLFGGWAIGSTESIGTEYSEFYESTQFKIPTADFETQMVGVKILGYWGVGVNNTGSLAAQMWSLIRGNGSSNIPMSSWNLDLAYLNADSGGVYLPQNMNTSTKVTAGAWHQFEMYAKLNDMGSANGIWKWWLDGVLIGDYENLTFINNSKPSGFFGRHLDGVWGGGGGTAKTRTDYVWFDHMYLSGVFLR